MTFETGSQEPVLPLREIPEAFSYAESDEPGFADATMTVLSVPKSKGGGLHNHDPETSDEYFDEETRARLQELLGIRPVLRSTGRLIRGAGEFTTHTVRIPVAFIPLLQLLARNENTNEDELAKVIDAIFGFLYAHPLTHQSRRVSDTLRRYRLIPNEQTTERLIEFVVNQAIARSPVPVPEPIIKEFWAFFHELFSAEELKGLLELNLDIVRLVLRTYQPLLVDLINLQKDARRINQSMLNELVKRVRVIRGDLRIIRRQIKALRYIKPFFQTDPDDFHTQAQIVARMVKEFGPFFIKMAQVAAANSDFLPDEISKELAVFQEDVPPMTPAEVQAAFLECLGQLPTELYYDFDIHNPVQSGSIGSVYLARKPVEMFGQQVLRPVILKVGRSNLEREFLMGKTAIGLALLSSQYWAPHSKLAPFLEAMLEQVDEFVRGFERELNFEIEAEIQHKFHKRADRTGIWKVPKVYRSTARILEMEYIDDALSLGRALARIPHHRKEKFQRKVADRFLYTLLTHVFVYQEFHGDLHPGNIMVNSEADLFLIDWGNAVKLEGRWQKLWNYITGVVYADVEQLADALIEISNDVELNRSRRSEIVETLTATLEKKEIQPLKGKTLRYLRSEGLEGLHRRFQTAMQLMSNTQQLGLVIESGYLHMSRSFFALSGSYATIYEGLPKSMMAVDTVRTFARFPVALTRDRVISSGRRLKEKCIDALPFVVVRKKTVRKPQRGFVSSRI